MSNHLAIAAVSATLSQLLQGAAGADLPGAAVRLGRPPSDGSPPAGPEISVFLYQVSPNAAYRNADLPVRGQDCQMVRRPRAALDLHYLLSFAGDEGRPGIAALHRKPPESEVEPALRLRRLAVALGAVRLEERPDVGVEGGLGRHRPRLGRINTTAGREEEQAGDGEREATTHVRLAAVAGETFQAV